MEPYEGQKRLFDVTVHEGHATYHHWSDVVAKLSPIAKKFVFQKEVGNDTQRVHWQVRLSLHKQKRHCEVLSQLIPLFPGHWSLTSSTVHNSGNQFNYVMKADTRIDGPWSENDVPSQRPPKTIMVNQIMAHYEANTLYPYQRYIYEQSVIYDPRWIDVILDTAGHTGKSSFCEWMEYVERGVEIPPLRDMQDLVGFVVDQPEAKAYMIDMPRGMKKDKLADFYAGVETVKNGYLYDKRYKGRKKRIERPRIFVFTNTVPVLDLLTIDRWRVWDISDVTKMVPWKPGGDMTDQFPDEE